MRSYNRVVLIGNITRDPDFRTTQNGTGLMTVGLAVNESRKDQNGNWIEEPNYFDVTVWGKSAEVVRDYAKKGDPLFVEGRLKQESWEQDGQKRSKVKVVAERINLLGLQGGNNNGGGSGNGYRNGGSGGYRANGGGSGYQNRGGYRSNNGGGYRSNGNGGYAQTSPQPAQPPQQYEEDDNIPF